MTPSPTAIILFAHGSRDPAWCKPIEAVAEQLQVLMPNARIGCAYLELTQPSLPALLEDWQKSTDSQALLPATVHIVPMFLGIGKHAKEDLPVLVSQLAEAHPQIQFLTLPALGDNPLMIQAIAQATFLQIKP